MPAVFTTYQETLKDEWDGFVTTQGDGIFPFCRNYLNYHNDRFTDASIMIYRKGRPCGVMPAHKMDNVLCTHRGLSFGGILWDHHTRTAAMQQVWESLPAFLKAEGFSRLIYHPVPDYYDKQGRSLDLFFMQSLGGKIIDQKISFVIDLAVPLRLNNNRRRNLAKPTSLQMNFDERLEDYWQILTELLEVKYQSRPVHDVNEIILLQQRFPEQIRLVSACKKDKMVAGILIFFYGNTIKLQYIASNLEGLESHAVSHLIRFIAGQYASTHRFMDMGTAYRDDGNLNLSLAFFKESFGAIPRPFFTLQWDL